jgi:hypothetical protein
MKVLLKSQYQRQIGTALIAMAVIVGVMMQLGGMPVLIMSEVSRTNFGAADYVISGQLHIRWMAAFPSITLVLFGLICFFWPQRHEK